MPHRYVVITNTSYSEFEHSVECLINEGWVLQGGVAVNGNQVLSQALVKYDLPPLTEGVKHIPISNPDDEP